MFHPSRGGVRGGRDQFDWEDIKKDKDRFNYLGNSLKAVVKKPWNQGPEADWYVKDGDITKDGKKNELLSEIEMIKAQEKALMETVLTKGFGYKHEEKIAKEPAVSVKSETERQVRTERHPKRDDDRRIERRHELHRDRSDRRDYKDERHYSDRRNEPRRARSRSPSRDRHRRRSPDRSRRYR